MHLPRIMLAAPASGSGKTMITCGVLQAFVNRELMPASFKCGPDYIDPMFHSKVIGAKSRNLDTFFSENDVTRYLFARTASNAGISVLEGVMGIFDGLGGTTPRASSYDLACTTDTPVILIVNARGMSLSVIPLIKGYVEYQKKLGKTVIRGVILNQMTKMTYLTLKSQIEEETGLKAYGYVPRLDNCQIESRHLGLVTPDEIKDLKNTLQKLSLELEESLDLNGMIALAHEAEDYRDEESEIPERLQKFFSKDFADRSKDESKTSEETQEENRRRNSDSGDDEGSGRRQTLCQGTEGASNYKKTRIAVALDEAFCFYYQDNLEMLAQMGAEIVPFSPIKDKNLPEHIHGLILGGGYPELYAKQLSENTAMLQSIRSTLQSGLPYLAECGGFMYLHESMEDMDGNAWPMCGVISGKSYKTPKLGRFGYITLEKEAIAEQLSEVDRRTDSDYIEDLRNSIGLLKTGEKIRAHEFHYFDSTNAGSDLHAAKPVGKRSWDCAHLTEKTMAGYPHLYYWSNPAFARAFLEECKKTAPDYS